MRGSCLSIRGGASWHHKLHADAESLTLPAAVCSFRLIKHNLCPYALAIHWQWLRSGYIVCTLFNTRIVGVKHFLSILPLCTRIEDVKSYTLFEDPLFVRLPTAVVIGETFRLFCLVFIPLENQRHQWTNWYATGLANPRETGKRRYKKHIL